MLFGQFPFYLDEEVTSSSLSWRKAALGEVFLSFVKHSFSHFVFQIIQRGEFSFPPNTNVSQTCRHLIRRMLTVDFRNRIEVDQILAHEWFLQDRNFANFTQTATPRICFQVSFHQCWIQVELIRILCD